MMKKLCRTVYFQLSQFSTANDMRVFVRYSGKTPGELQANLRKKLDALKAEHGKRYKYVQISPPYLDASSDEQTPYVVALIPVATETI